MPDDIIISELSNAPQIDDSAVFPLTQDNGGSPATFKATMSQIAGKIGEGTTFANLHTTSKTLVGALNELQDGGGGSTEIIGTASGSIATFADGGNGIPLKSCEVEIVAQQASGTPSPSSPKSISGFSAVDLVDCGVNLWDEDWEVGGIDDTTGEKTSSGQIRSVNYIACKPGMTFFVVGGSNTNVYIYFYQSDKTFIGRAYLDSSYNVKNKAVITPATCSYLMMKAQYIDVNEYHNDISLNYPHTDTNYHSSSANTFTIPLGRTLYGGTAELVGGNGTKTYRYDLFDGSSDEDWMLFAEDTNYLTFRIYLAESILSYSNSGKGIYNWAKYGSGGESGNVICRGNQASNGVQFFVMIAKNLNLGITDLATFKTYLSNHNLQAVNKLATPTSFTFTGATIPTLSGTNNIYADSGDVNELEYFNEKADDIASMVRLMTRT